MELVTRPHRTHLVDWAATRPEVLVLSADLTASCEADLFRDAYPDRFLTLGMAEQNMMGFAAGLAREGFAPFVHTFAVFVCRRPFDQVAMSIAYPALRVRLLGFLPGVTTPGGVTHQAVDDLALMRAVPNMTILECGDATDVESVLDVAHAVDGPVYVRMLRGDVPRLFTEPMELGRPRVLSDGTDLALVTTGICTEQALRVTGPLRRRGVGIRHLHVSTLKPFDPTPILDAAESTRHGLVTLENHGVVGGLGTTVAEALAEAGCGRRLVRLGLQDTYAHGASREYLLHEYGLDAPALLIAIERLLGERFGLEEEDLVLPDRTGPDLTNPEAL